jgi:hypothetical protein
VGSFAVRSVLAHRLTIEFPRSWSKEDRELAASLPPEIRAILFKREDQRDTALRRAQNALAEEKKQLAAEAEKNSAIQDKGQLSL